MLSASLLSTVVPLAAAADVAPGVMNPAGFAIQRGTNLSHWLSQDFKRAPRRTWITEYDLRYIARLGFDHVRLPIDEKELWAENGLPDEDAFALMLACIGWARENGLRVIVDLHTVRAHHFNASNEGMAPNTLWTDAKAQEHFLGLWRELSRRLRHLPVDQVAYEVMNEPVADDHQDWNRLVALAMKEIRKEEPGRVVVLGSNRWQTPSTLPFLEVPAGDKNIILSTHTYAPFIFTHHRAGWTPIKVYTGAVHYPGLPISKQDYEKLLASGDERVIGFLGEAKDEWGRDRIRRVLEPAIKRAQELGLQLYCGEFGCLPTVPRADRLAYYRDIVAVFEANGLAWANWEYKGDFGIFEWHASTRSAGAPDVELIDALLVRGK